MEEKVEDTKKIYLDYNATTPLAPEVLSTINDALQNAWGNPSSSHDAGVKAKVIIDKSRLAMAHMIGAQASDIIFTSGGTEANNMVINTALKYFGESYPNASDTIGFEVGSYCPPRWELPVKPHIITSNLEHDSIKLPLNHFQEAGLADVTYVAASPRSGRVEVEDVISAIKPTTCLITIMLANNETGVIQPVAEISERVKQIKRNPKNEVSRILLHTDAAQAIGKVQVDVSCLGVDYLTIVGHKFYGPRIGALYVNGPGVQTPLEPMLFGGGQERNFRPGTENTGMIAGLGKAAELVNENIVQYECQMSDVRDYLEQQLLEAFGKDNVHFNGKFSQSERLPNTCNVSILGPAFRGHSVLAKCCRLQASVGAACHSDSAGSRASPILLAIGIKPEVAINAIRLSVGRETTKEDINIVVKDLKQATGTL